MAGRMTGTVLVVGCGLVGSHVASLLAERGYEITCADLDETRARALAGRVGATPVRVDTRAWSRTRRIVAALAPDVVIDAAGVLRFTDGEASAALLGDTARGAYTLAAAAAEAGARCLINTSSLGVYARGAAGPVCESMPPASATAYGAAKAAAEAAALSATAGTGTRMVIVRLAGVVGGVPSRGGGRLNEALFRLFAAHAAGRTVRIRPMFGGREYLDVRDAAAGIAAAADHGADGAVYNIGTGRPLSTADVARAFQDIGALAVADPGPGASSWWLDVHRAKRDLGFHATLSLSDTLRGWACDLTPEGRAV